MFNSAIYYLEISLYLFHACKMFITWICYGHGSELHLCARFNLKDFYIKNLKPKKEPMAGYPR